MGISGGDNCVTQSQREEEAFDQSCLGACCVVHMLHKQASMLFNLSFFKARGLSTTGNRVWGILSVGKAAAGELFELHYILGESACLVGEDIRYLTQFVI